MGNMEKESEKKTFPFKNDKTSQNMAIKIAVVSNHLQSSIELGPVRVEIIRYICR